MHGMQRWIRAILLLGCSILSSCTPQEDAIVNAINTCNHELNTDFDFKFLEVPLKKPQNNGRFFKHPLYFRRQRPQRPHRQRLFPWLYKPPQYQFVLTTAWKKPPTANPDLEPGTSNDMVVRTCSGFLSQQDPIKYTFTCSNVTQEGLGGNTTIEVSPVTIAKLGEAEEGSGYKQDEDDSWDLSRCLGCIFGMLNKQRIQ